MTQLRIRRFENEANRNYTAGKMRGFLHLYIGQESVAVGTCSLLGTNDHVITAYRDHGHALAVGMSMNECMAELFGKATGCSKGKGGSMHFFAPDKNYWGGLVGMYNKFKIHPNFSLYGAMIYKTSGYNYQTFVLSSGFLYILSPGCTLKAAYHASILVIGALVRYCSGECGSVNKRWAAASGRCELLQT